MAGFGFGTTLDTPFDTAIERVTGALKAEGFGVLSRLDIHAILEKKIGATMDPYVILGACNPQLANQAIQNDAEIGLLLPCNVLVRALPDGRTAVSFANPAIMGELTEAEGMKPLMADAEARLRRALAALA